MDLPYQKYATIRNLFLVNFLHIGLDLDLRLDAFSLEVRFFFRLCMASLAGWFSECGGKAISIHWLFGIGNNSRSLRYFWFPTFYLRGLALKRSETPDEIKPQLVDTCYLSLTHNIAKVFLYVFHIFSPDRMSAISIMCRERSAQNARVVEFGE